MKKIPKHFCKLNLHLTTIYLFNQCLEPSFVQNFYSFINLFYFLMCLKLNQFFLETSCQSFLSETCLMKSTRLTWKRLSRSTRFVIPSSSVTGKPSAQGGSGSSPWKPLRRQKRCVEF